MFKLIFFGTGDFAVPSLRALANDPSLTRSGQARFDVIAVVTQPDRPVGRHATLTPPPVKVAAMELGIKTIQQPEKMKDEAFRTWIESVGKTCDAFVVVSYGKILPKWLLDLPKHGAVNVHGSLLPRWRGASPIHAAIAAGDTKSGVTIMQVDAEMDHGAILSLVETPIALDETGGSLHDRLAVIGAKTLPDTLDGYLNGSVTPVSQNDSLATPCNILSREDGKINWSLGADEITRRIRALNPWPGCWTVLEGKRLKIHKADAITGDDAFASGQCFVFEKRPAVACGNGTAIELINVQPEGRSEMDGKAFLAGLKGWEQGKL
jgi:methionyl-tRNA formyltransferase